MSFGTIIAATLAVALGLSVVRAAEPDLPHPVTNPESPIMLGGSWLPDDPHQIDFKALPRVPSEHVVVSDVREKRGVNQHNYLALHDGKFWAMWSDGPGIEDRVGQVVKYSTSNDGLSWSEPQFLAPYPPNSRPDSVHYNTRTDEGMRWISRGFWKRDGKLLALASLDEAAGFFGSSLELRAFRFDDRRGGWEDAGLVCRNAINNFPPKKLRTGDWLMSRRPYNYAKTGVQFLVGGRQAIDDWKSYPVLGSAAELKAEEPSWWILPDDCLSAIFRDNRRSGFLYRAFSTDDGRTWSRPVKTNFPDATSKVRGMRLSDGRYVLVSNANPRARDPLTLAVSNDGLVFHKLMVVVDAEKLGYQWIDYPDVMEHQGSLYIAFAENKASVNVLRIKLSDLNKVTMPASVKSKQPLPPVTTQRAQPKPWIDLGDEGKTLYAAADLIVPQRGKRAAFSLATAGGEQRVTIGIDAQGRLTAWLYNQTSVLVPSGRKLPPGSRQSLLFRIHSHREEPDELLVQLGPAGEIPSEPENWMLSNRKGSSAANLSRVILYSDAETSSGFAGVRIAPTYKALSEKAATYKAPTETAPSGKSSEGKSSLNPRGK